MTELIKIEINRDNVVIEKAIVLRPDHIGVDEWREFWENARENQNSSYEEAFDNGFKVGYDQGYEEAILGEPK